ncbi:MAG TPA: type III secretion protein [Hyphomicrobiales bacterium]
MLKLRGLRVTRKLGARRLGLSISLGILLAALLPHAARAGEPAWPTAPYKYFIIDQDARDVLVEFGRNLNLPVHVSDGVAGRRIRGSIPELAPKDFLQRICESYGLVWYYDGAMLHINIDGEVATEFISLDLVRPEAALRRLEELRIADPRFTVRATENAGVIAVSGPPPYRSMVRKTVDALEESLKPRSVREVKAGDDVKVRVFRGGS